MHILRIACTVSLLTVLASELPAQEVAARLLIAGGTATDLRGVRSGAYTLAPSLSLTPHANLGLSLGGRGTRFTTEEWALGGWATAAMRLPLGAGVGLLLTGSGDATRTSYEATYLFAEGLPALEWRSARVSLWAGARAAVAETRVAAALPGGPGLPGAAASLTRSQLGPAFGGALSLSRFGGRGLVELRYREEHGAPADLRVTDRTLGLGLARGALRLEGALGLRQAPDESRTFGAARVLVTLTSWVALSGAAESYPANRLTGAPGGRAFTAGLSLGISGLRRSGALPKPAGIAAPRPGITRLSLNAAQATTVEVAGDWNGWRPVPLARSHNGVWYVDLAIPPGGYRYAFRINGKAWTVPKGIAAVDDGFGGKSAWLTVGEPARTEAQSANRKEVP